MLLTPTLHKIVKQKSVPWPSFAGVLQWVGLISAKPWSVVRNTNKPTELNNANKTLLVLTTANKNIILNISKEQSRLLSFVPA